MGTMIPAILFGLIGLGCLAGIAWLIGRSIAQELQGYFERHTFAHRKALLNQAQILMDGGDLKGAATHYRDALYLKHAKTSEKFIDLLTEHNLSVLGSLIIVAERGSLHLSNLPIIEELIITRAAMMKAYLETLVATRALRNKGQSGKTAPDWAINEFRRKLSELDERIETNRGLLLTEIDKLIQALGGKTTSVEVTYH